jgi:hypothetical protein
MAADWVIRWTTAGAVVGVAAIAAVASYEHSYALVRAAQAFAGEVAAGRVPLVRAIRARLHVGQPQAQRVREYLAAAVNA